MSAGPRLAPVPREEWDDEVRAAFATAFPDDVVARFLSTGPDAIPVPTALATMMCHPALAGPFLAYNNVLLATPMLDARHRELVILRVARRTRAPYEWAQHARLAARVGITPEEIDAVADAVHATWTPLEATLLTAVDELIDDHRVSDGTWGRLARALDDRQLVELVFVVGTYTCLAMVFNSFGLELDPGLEAFAPRPGPEE